MNKPYFYPLHHTRLLFIEGPEAAKFLQGQVTCDVRELAQQRLLLGAQCSPKGRVLLSFYAAQLQPEHIALRLPHSLAVPAQASLGRYIVFSKAKIRLAEHWQHLGFSQADSTALQPLLGTLPAIGHWAAHALGYVWRLNDTQAELWIAPPQDEATQSVLKTLTTSLQALVESGTIQEGSPDAWDLLHIRQGIAQVTPNTQDMFTPQELNLTLVGGVNFRKGCYTGQEIVARLHYRGQAKRHLRRFFLASAQRPTLGDAISDTAGKTIGHLVNIAQSDAGYELLASVSDAHHQQAQLAQGDTLQLLSLPYAIPSDDDSSAGASSHE